MNSENTALSRRNFLQLAAGAGALASMPFNSFAGSGAPGLRFVATPDNPSVTS